MNSRIYRHIKSLPMEEQIPYINHAILSINKSRSNKRDAGNLSSIINELKQIKEKLSSKYFLANNNLNNSEKVINSLFHEYVPKSIDIHQSTIICILLKIKDY